VRGQATGDSAAVDPSPERALLPLIRAESEGFAGDSAAKDFFVQLPEHVQIRDGNELRLALYPSLEILSRLCTITASVNGKRLTGATIEGKSLDNISDLAIRVRFPIAENGLVRGWNRVSVGFLRKRPSTGAGAANEPGTWTVRRSDSYLAVAYERLPMFPELQRFPGSFAEEKLLRPRRNRAESVPPTLALLVPAERRDVHLRACAIIGARLGQLGYLTAEDCRLGLINSDPRERSERNGIVVALRDELGSLPLPKNIAEKLGSAGKGQGLIAEFIEGVSPDQRRWLLVTGADENGLEKAILTLGHAPALAAAPPNPAVIESVPSISPELEGASQPGVSRLLLKDLSIPDVRLNGIDTIEESVSGWRLPPGFELSSGVLDLQLSHSPALVSPGSSLEVLVNGTRAGIVDLTPGTAMGGSARVSLPKGLAGRDPMLLTFRVLMDVPPLDCDQRKEDEPWLLISASSSLDIVPSLARVDSLGQIGRLFLRDSFLRRAALLAPANLSLAEARWLLEFSMDLGKHLPSSPVLWPEVCRYSQLVSPPSNRLQDRSVLVLGSVGQWKSALPPGARVPVQMTDAQNGSVRMQGRDVSLASLEPSLAFLQMTASPWSPGELLVVAGGWDEFATPTLLRMLAEPETAAELSGNICAMDVDGRVAAYDTRIPARDSLAERIQGRIPHGLTVDQTKERLEAQKALRRWHGSVNTVVFYGGGFLFVFIVGCRLLFMWERTRLLKAARREQNPLEHVL